jgi:putrescine aminotransferase
MMYARNMTNLWHPFADMSKVSKSTVNIVRGEGVYLWDDASNRYIDSSSALWFCNVGHGRRELADAAAKQMATLAHYSTFGEMTNEPAERLAERVCAMSPLGADSAAMFTSGGSDAIDTAAKLARRFWVAKGEPNRTVIIARNGAYHGVNGFGTALGGLAPNTTGYGPLVGDIVHVPFDDADALEKAMIDAGDRLAAVIGELVQGAAGVMIPPSDYWTQVSELTKHYGALLIVDEVITGFGRLGYPFACERFNIVPDFIVSAKGITSGYIPLGVVIAATHVRDTLWAEEVGMIRHGYTYSGHGTACAVGLANLDVLEGEDLYSNVLKHEKTFLKMLAGVAEHPLVREYRGIGFMAAVELSEDALASRPTLADDLVRAARSHGLLTRNLLGRAVQISPPLTCGEAEIAAIGAALLNALEDINV